MVYLAELNESNIVTSVKMTKSFIDDGKHVEIENVNSDLLWRKYDVESGEFSQEKFIPDHSQIELSRMEKLEKSQTEQDEIIMQMLLGGE